MKKIKSQMRSRRRTESTAHPNLALAPALNPLPTPNLALTRNPLCWLLLAVAAGCSQQRPAPAPSDSAQPAIRIDKIDQPPGHCFTLTVAAQPKDFTVHVVGPDGPSPLAMAGDYSSSDKSITFTPRYPLQPGVRYRAVYGQVTAEIELPKPKLEATTVVEHIYPSGSVLPENLLRFYVQFSAPMSRGDVYKHVKLIDDKGKAIELPFLELDEEFWDPEQKRFTLFFDPGRIKRGVKPREDLGPALEEGRSYRLVIDKGWTDASGAPLKDTYVKQFKVVAPDDQSPDPKTWKIDPPAAGSREPLTLRFPEPLDHGMLHHLIAVLGPDGQRLAGEVRVSDEETGWRFTPAQAWTVGEHQLAVKTTLEDRSGNSVERPFELDVFNPIQKKIEPGVMKLPFSIKW